MESGNTVTSWNIELGVGESNYRSAFRSVPETKLQVFQFKLLHRIIPCNKYLHSIRVKDEDTCSFCGGLNTPSHFFFYCTVVQTLWSSLCTWTDRHLNLNLADVEVKEFLSGVPRSNPQAPMLNFILLSLKFYIYRQKMYHEADLDLMPFLRELRCKLRIEEYICNLEGKPDKFHI